MSTHSSLQSSVFGNLIGSLAQSILTAPELESLSVSIASGKLPVSDHQSLSETCGPVASNSSCPLVYENDPFGEYKT